MRRLMVALGAVLLAGAGQADAHHSFAAEFDAAHPVTLAGKLITLEWVNPHSLLWIDVDGPRGRTEQRGSARWGIELPPPNGMMRRGLRLAMFRPGDRITIRAYPARDGRRFASGQVLVLADGRKVVMGPATSAGRP